MITNEEAVSLLAQYNIVELLFEILIYFQPDKCKSSTITTTSSSNNNNNNNNDIINAASTSSSSINSTDTTTDVESVNLRLLGETALLHNIAEMNYNTDNNTTTTTATATTASATATATTSKTISSISPVHLLIKSTFGLVRNLCADDTRKAVVVNNRYIELLFSYLSENEYFQNEGKFVSIIRRL